MIPFLLFNFPPISCRCNHGVVTVTFKQQVNKSSTTLKQTCMDNFSSFINQTSWRIFCPKSAHELSEWLQIGIDVSFTPSHTKWNPIHVLHHTVLQLFVRVIASSVTIGATKALTAYNNGGLLVVIVTWQGNTAWGPKALCLAWKWF